MPKGLTVAAVEKASIAEELEIVPGDKIIAVNGQTVRDIIDFQYYTADEEFVLWVEKKDDGEIWELEIERTADESLGIFLTEVSAEGLKLCKNNCVFCFVAQMPKGMRKSLYDKDDDYRLSLTQGSFITLSNLSDDDLDKIIKMHLSPLYVSVHAWDPQVRVMLLKNPKAARLPDQLRKLAQAGITLHTQIVLVPGYNDGEILAETAAELAKLHPAVQSIAVVPVGLTKFRQKLAPLRTFSQSEAKQLLDWGEAWQKTVCRKTGKNLLYFSDEFYVLAKRDFPPLEMYDELFQLENGVGMTSKFRQEITNSWSKLPRKIKGRHVHIITGVSAFSFFQDLQRRLEEYIEGLEITLHLIENNYFGPTVTVAGLLTAGDIAAQVGDLNGEVFLIPRVMLKADEDVFLDDCPIDWLENKINGQAMVVENEGEAFLQALLGKECLESDF